MSEWGMPDPGFNMPYMSGTGVSRSEETFACDECEERVTVEVEYDGSVGASEFLEVPACPECGKDLSDQDPV